METDSLSHIYDNVSALLPPWGQAALVGVFAVAKVLVNLPWTPSRPAAEAGWWPHAAYWAYRAAEVAALVGPNAKKRPDVAVTAAALGDAAAAGRLAVDDAVKAFRQIERSLS